VGKGDLYWVVDELFTKRERSNRTRKKKKEVIMSDDMVKVTETTKEYELLKIDLVADRGEDEPTWYNRTAGIIDKFRLIPRLIMLAYIYAFYSTTVWFMSLSNPTNAQAAFISTIVGAGAAFFGLYVGKPGASIPKGRK
jgi:hypothetical protein